MSDIQDSLGRAHDAALDAETAKGKAEQAYKQAVAEETYEYAVQAKTGSKWEHMQDGFFRDAWFSELRKAKAGARELRSIGKETRIVRRRLSPPEIINDCRTRDIHRPLRRANGPVCDVRGFTTASRNGDVLGRMFRRIRQMDRRG